MATRTDGEYQRRDFRQHGEPRVVWHRVYHAVGFHVVMGRLYIACTVSGSLQLARWAMNDPQELRRRHSKVDSYAHERRRRARQMHAHYIGPKVSSTQRNQRSARFQYAPSKIRKKYRLGDLTVINKMRFKEEITPHHRVPS